MCKMLIPEVGNARELEFMVYNLAFSEASGKFTEEQVAEGLRRYNIIPEPDYLRQIFERWEDLGLIFDDANAYVINMAVC